MHWSNLFWLILGLDCDWVAGANGTTFCAYVMLTDRYAIPLQVMMLIVTITCARVSLCLLWNLLRPLFLSREQRLVERLRKQAQKASADYLRLFR